MLTSLKQEKFMLLALILLIASYVVLNKTRFGLRLQACGEHPQAADSVGINVYKMRYAGVLISGLMVAFSQNKQALHDMICDTIVVDRWAFTDQPELQNDGLDTITKVILGLFVLLVLGGIVLAVIAGAALASMAG